MNRFGGASSPAVRLLIVMVMSSALVGAGATLASATERSTTTTTTFPANVRQPPQEPVHLGRASTPPPLISARLAKKYPTILPLLKAGLRVFAAVEASGHRVRVTALGPESSMPFPGDPKASIPNPGEFCRPGRNSRRRIGPILGAGRNDGNEQRHCRRRFPGGPLWTRTTGSGISGSTHHQLSLPRTSDRLLERKSRPRWATLASWATVQSITRLPLDVPERPGRQRMARH